MAKKDEELIIGIERNKLFREDEFCGFSTSYKTYIRRIEQDYTTRRRGECEHDPSFKQVIPYMLIKKQDKLFTLKRLPSQGEQRLHNKVSVGVGGHMNPVSQGENWLYENAWRELNEEINIKTSDIVDWEIIGCINDDETDVGRVHFGIAMLLQVRDNAVVGIREHDKMTGDFVATSELCGVVDHMESWSRLALSALLDE